ncbi:hypothetical protein PV10_06085 [Exophiala mesophila]|uniref:Uncharacterized protein n=1 Tax=Exophiala mesophila TaxID=212818 RepID=A0A0D1ZA67_EXOME|nr:uncharacterized protein PV10_06085 [Exophiala mesophila]KIV91557.1 hypothetical protein PV10_06085 [Exophiala mesophila]
MKSTVELKSAEHVFSSRKESVNVRTSATTFLTCDIQQSTTPVDCPCHDEIWIPRAQGFNVLVHLVIDCRFHVSLSTASAATEAISHYVERAELWSQLGYEVTRTVATDAGWTRSRGRVHLIEYEMRQCIGSADDVTLACPEDVPVYTLQSVRLDMEIICSDSLTTNKRAAAHPSPKGADPSTQGSSNNIHDGGEPPDNTEEKIRTHESRSNYMILGEDTLVGLTDACFRGCIATKPTRLGRGIHIQGNWCGPSLCDIAPNVFNPGYAQKFEARVYLIPVIAHFLSRSHLRRRSATGNGVLAPSSVSPHQVMTSSSTGRGNINSVSYDMIRRHLWVTLANALRECTAARKLCPLWSLPAKDDNRSEWEFCDLAKSVDREFYDLALNYGISSQQTGVANGVNTGQDRDMDMYISAIAPGTEAQGCARSRPMSDCTPKQSSNSLELMASVFHDSDDNGIVQEGAGVAFSTTEISPLGPSETRSRGEAYPKDRDVSRLIMPDHDRNDGIGKRSANTMLDLIGGTTWLTHGATRLRPLMHLNHGIQACQETVAEDGYEGSAAPINMPHALNAAVGDQYYVDVPKHLEAEPHSQHSCSSFDRLTDPDIDVASGITDTSVISAIQDTIYDDDSAEEDYTLDELHTMATSQQERDRESRASLADLLGNEHLLWKMFQRRGSVAPQGEEDMDDMKRLYESDPDMKLFGPGWNLSPSDVSSSSNEDPMLQDIGPRQTPNAPSKPPTPSTERRSYVGTVRPTSSSSMGKQSTDPKYQRRSSLIKRFQWGGRKPTTELGDVEENKTPREPEIKRRRTLDDYDTMSLDDTSDESNEMLFR